MRTCPFCGVKVKPVFPYLTYMEDLNKWGLFHHCNEKCSVVISAETKEEVFAIWEGEADA